MLNEGATIINLRGIIAVNRLPDKKQRLGTRINKIGQKQEIISASLSDMSAADDPSAAMASKWVLLRTTWHLRLRGRKFIPQAKLA